MGFDRPCDGFFMMIDYLEELEEDDDSYIYSNMWEKIPHPPSLTRYINKLAELDISIPAEMIQEIEQDGEIKMGNKCVRHAMVNGTYTRNLIS